MNPDPHTQGLPAGGQSRERGAWVRICRGAWVHNPSGHPSEHVTSPFGQQPANPSGHATVQSDSNLHWTLQCSTYLKVHSQWIWKSLDFEDPTRDQIPPQTANIPQIIHYCVALIDNVDGHYDLSDCVAYRPADVVERSGRSVQHLPTTGQHAPYIRLCNGAWVYNPSGHPATGIQSGSHLHWTLQCSSYLKTQEGWIWLDSDFEVPHQISSQTAGIPLVVHDYVATIVNGHYTPIGASGVYYSLGDIVEHPPLRTNP